MLAAPQCLCSQIRLTPLAATYYNYVTSRGRLEFGYITFTTYHLVQRRRSLSCPLWRAKRPVRPFNQFTQP